MSYSPLLTELVQALQCLPGVGPKSAQRMAFNLLDKNRDKGMRLSASLEQALTNIGHCDQCRTFSENAICSLCENPRRAEAKSICVVESPADVVAIEQTGHYQGRYFVLMGHLSPLDGIGPAEIGLDKLAELIRKEDISELILATNPTVEGETTAHFIAEMAKKHQINTSRIAHGVPIGGELEYVDGTTLGHAMRDRKQF